MWDLYILKLQNDLQYNNVDEKRKCKNVNAKKNNVAEKWTM